MSLRICMVSYAVLGNSKSIMKPHSNQFPTHKPVTAKKWHITDGANSYFTSSDYPLLQHKLKGFKEQGLRFLSIKPTR